MSVGTNENVKNVTNMENVEEIKNQGMAQNSIINDAVTNEVTTENSPNIENKIENSEANNQKPKFDMDATQRIVFLDELKDINFLQQNEAKNQGGFVPENNENNANVIEQLNAKVEQNVTNNINNSNSEISVEINAQNVEIENSGTSIPNVQETPNNFNNESKNIINEAEANSTANGNETINENTQTESDNKIEENKEKQHAQDKKDYRLEKMLFDRINKMQGKIKESLELIKKFERINAKEENLPNIVTTLHDKLTHEVIKQFRTVGIEFNMKSFLVQSVVSDLLGKFEEGITEFRDCSENLNFVREVQDDFESRVELAPTSKVKNFFARIRGMFKPERKQERLEELERERQEKKLQEANIHLLKYKFINGELEKYTIKKDITKSLSREMLHGQGSGLNLSVNDFVNQKIVPEMSKLGLENLIPELKNKIYSEYMQKEGQVPNEEFENATIGLIRKNMKLSQAERVLTKVSNVVDNNNVRTQNICEDDERVAI